MHSSKTGEKKQLTSEGFQPKHPIALKLDYVPKRPREYGKYPGQPRITKYRAPVPAPDKVGGELRWRSFRTRGLVPFWSKPGFPNMHAKGKRRGWMLTQLAAMRANVAKIVKDWMDNQKDIITTDDEHALQLIRVGMEIALDQSNKPELRLKAINSVLPYIKAKPQAPRLIATMDTADEWLKSVGVDTSPIIDVTPNEEEGEEGDE